MHAVEPTEWRVDGNALCNVTHNDCSTLSQLLLLLLLGPHSYLRHYSPTGIRQMSFSFGRLTHCAPHHLKSEYKKLNRNAEIARHVSQQWTHWLLPPKCKTPNFSYHTGLPAWVEFWGSQDSMIWVGLGLQIAKKRICLFIDSDHNWPTLQTGMQTHSISATFKYLYAVTFKARYGHFL